ncbi:MAG: hypothetical protein ABW133_23185, partial [Polyangiaceae bacterium]
MRFARFAMPAVFAVVAWTTFQGCSSEPTKPGGTRTSGGNTTSTTSSGGNGGAGGTSGGGGGSGGSGQTGGSFGGSIDP